MLIYFLLPMLAIFVFVALCVLLSIVLKRKMPFRAGPPQMQHRIDPDFLTQYWHLVQSTLGWLDRHGLPITRFSRSILHRVSTPDEDSPAFGDHPVEPQGLDLGRVVPDDLRPPLPVRH